MKDQISITRASALHPAINFLVPKCIDVAEARLGQYAAVRIVQGLRTFPEQQAIWSIGRITKGPNARPGRPMGDVATNAKPGQSFHQYGLAVDFAILYDKDKNGNFESLSWDLVADMNRDGESDWHEVVDAFEAQGFEWGGQWISLKDNPHVQKVFGHTWQDLLQKYNAELFIPGTSFVAL